MDRADFLWHNDNRVAPECAHVDDDDNAIYRCSFRLVNTALTGVESTEFVYCLECRCVIRSRASTGRNCVRSCLPR